MHILALKTTNVGKYASPMEGMRPSCVFSSKVGTSRSYLGAFEALCLGDLSNEQTGCLGYMGDEKLCNYVGIIINHYEDPY